MRRWTQPHPIKENDPVYDLHITDFYLAIEERIRFFIKTNGTGGQTLPIFYYKRDYEGSNHLIWGADYPKAGQLSIYNQTYDSHLYSARRPFGGEGWAVPGTFAERWHNNYLSSNFVKSFFKDAQTMWIATDLVVTILGVGGPGDDPQWHDYWRSLYADPTFAPGEHFYDVNKNDNSPEPKVKLQHINQIRSLYEQLVTTFIKPTHVYYREKIGTLTDQYEESQETFLSNLKAAVLAASWSSWQSQAVTDNWVWGECEVFVIAVPVNGDEDWYYDDGILTIREFKTTFDLDIDIRQSEVWPPPWARYPTFPSLEPPSIGETVIGGDLTGVNKGYHQWDGLLIKNRTTGAIKAIDIGHDRFNMVDADIISSFGGTIDYEWTAKNEWSSVDVDKVNNFDDMVVGWNYSSIYMHYQGLDGSVAIVRTKPNWYFGAP